MARFDNGKSFSKAVQARIQRAYDKLTPAQQRKADQLAHRATKSATAHSTASDDLYTAGEEMDAAYQRYAKQLKLPATFFIG